MGITRPLLLIFTLGLFAGTAHAGPASCALAINNCVGGGKAVAGAIKASRSACQALRDCKKVCKSDHKDNKKAAKSNKKNCRSQCKSKKGKSKRSCMKNCRKTKKSAVKSSKGVKKGCLKSCRAQYKNTGLQKSTSKACEDTYREGDRMCVESLVSMCSARTIRAFREP